MALKYLVYYFMLTACLGLSAIDMRRDNKLVVFTILMALTLGEELFVEWLLYRKDDYLYIYHLYLPVYFGLFLYYLRQYTTAGWLRVLMASLIPCFAVVSLALSFRQSMQTDYPGLQLNIAGGLLIVFALLVLLKLDVQGKRPIYRMAVFWISTATLVFYGGIFALNGVYDYLIKSDSAAAESLHNAINVSLNYLNYLLIIIGLLWSRPGRN